MTAPATSSVGDSQRSAARVGGFLYLFTDVTAIFAQLYVRSHLVVYDDAARTLANITAHGRLFRLGVLCELITFGGLIGLVAAFYVVLKPISPGLALLGAFWRLAENIVLAVMTFSSFQVLELSGDPYYSRSLGADHVQALVRLFVATHGDAYEVGLIFAGLGTAAFAFVFLESRYIPRRLAILGVASASLVAAHCSAVILFPALADAIEPWVFLPLLAFELTTGGLLLVKGITCPDDHTTCSLRRP
jgi:hypothetical protein